MHVSRVISISVFVSYVNAFFLSLVPVAMTITLLTPLVRAAVCYCLVELITQLTELPGQTDFYSL